MAPDSIGQRGSAGAKNALLPSAHTVRFRRRTTLLINFPSGPAFWTTNRTIAFAAFVDGVEVICELSLEAIEEHFGASRSRRDSMIAAFDRHCSRIEAVAQRVIPQRLAAGRCPLFSRDFY
ncbi:DUF1488 family protein [Paraburkholderia tropica]|uniref:DUF1488 domain-containing protein n=1 Tax=Paraburkholderia tropica TaxID=92647 RepID=UPI002AAF98D1|nr:DUF1488 domain-containing protein [Paraburkholderia tropica]